MFKNTFLFIVIGLGLAPGIQPAPLSNDTIVSFMRRDLTSPFGNCSFPPTDVLSMVAENRVEEQFSFLQKCNVKPSRIIHDPDVLLCMTLYEIGLRICQGFREDTRNLPNNLQDFRTLIAHDPNNDQHTSICPEMNAVLEEPTFPQTKYWNLKSTLIKKSDACSKICYDYMDNENLLCKLILLGSQLIKHPSQELHPDQTQVEALTDTKISSSEPQRVSMDSSPSAELPSAVNIGGKPRSMESERQQQETNQMIPEQLANSPTINLHPEEKSVLDSPTNFDLQDPVSKNQHSQSHMIASESDTGREVSSAKHNTGSDSIGEGIRSKTPSSQSEKQRITSPLSDPSQESSNLHNELPKSSDALPKSNLSPQQVGSSTAGTVKSFIDETADKPSDHDFDGPETSDEESPGPVGTNDDLFEHVDAPDEPAGDNRNSFKSTLDAEDSSNNGNVYTREKYDESEESHFFSYFTTMVLLCIIGYLIFHNKQKILALVLEGRSRRNNRRRPNTANYHKLDCNLEEAVSSPCNTSSTHVIY